MLRTVVQLHLAGAAQHLRGNDLSSPLRRIHHAALLGRDLLQLGIGFVLIFETAHQPPAGAGYFGRVKRQVLILGHIDRNRMEVLQIRGAAQLAAAGAQAADHLRFIAHADLPQLDTGAEYAGQILDQLAEVHAAICRKIKQHFVHIKGTFDRDQVHVQPAFLDLALADDKRLVRALFIPLERFSVRVGRHAQHAFERLHNRLVRYVGAVSYTHLDVYKRQDCLRILFTVAVIAAKINLAFLCLHLGQTGIQCGNSRFPRLAFGIKRRLGCFCVQFGGKLL